jgi:N-methylhydantoinase B
LNDAAGRIVFRSSRFADFLRADIEAAIAACRTGGERVGELMGRFGRDAVFEAFGALLEDCRNAVRDELLPRIPDGAYSWEDYVGSDGVTPEKAHAVKLKMIKAEGKLTLDFRGTAPQSAGPVNWPGNFADGRYLKIGWLPCC